MTTTKTPQETQNDMSIDELSAAIDAHMVDIEKPKPKRKLTNKKAKTEDKEKTPQEVTDEHGGEEDGTAIAVNQKHSYVSKNKSKNNKAPPKEEKSQITHTSNVVLKPLSESVKKENKAKPRSQSKTTMTDIVVRTVPSEKVATQNTEEKSEETEAEQPKTTEDVEEAKNKPPEKKLEPTKLVETEEKPVIKKESPSNRDADELNSQIASSKFNKAEPTTEEGEALKTFDTKQYHIPLKTSHHHRKNSSLKVFIVVLAVILATIYVLNELEIIDLVSLVVSS